MTQAQDVAVRFADNAKSFAEWCERQAKAFPHAKAFYVALAKKARRDERELRRAA